MITCDAKIRPLPNDTEISCGKEPDHDGDHVGVLRDYAYPGSETKFHWHESDRRNFHGDWPGRCGSGACILPEGHRGGHAS